MGRALGQALRALIDCAGGCVQYVFVCLAHRPNDAVGVEAIKCSPMIEIRHREYTAGHFGAV